MRWKLGAHLAGCGRRQDGEGLDALEVVGDPVDHVVTDAPELVRLHRWSMAVPRPSAPSTSTVDGSSPPSSFASRSAASASVSPLSRRPPGKLTSPVCERRSHDRRVSTVYSSPWRS